jgi:chaperonin GroEL (HSP60 family)
MAAKQGRSDEEARRAIQRGLDKRANAVRATRGPTGRNVTRDKKRGAPPVPKGGGTARKRPTGPPRHWPSPSSTRKGRP